MFLSKSEYQHTIDLLKGKEKPDYILSSLQDFFQREFDVRLYDYFTDEISDGEYRLRYIVWDESVHESFFTHTENFYGRDRKKEEKIKNEFSRLCQETDTNRPFQNPEGYFATPSTIADEILTDIQHKATEPIKQYLDTLEQVKRYEFNFDTVHIFYETDNDITAHENDGLSKEIANNILSIKQQFDDFSIITDGGVVFTSLQTLNEKFAGNMFYYFR